MNKDLTFWSYVQSIDEMKDSKGLYKFQPFNYTVDESFNYRLWKKAPTPKSWVEGKMAQAIKLSTTLSNDRLKIQEDRRKGM
jgi:hypothetical protein